MQKGFLPGPCHGKLAARLHRAMRWVHLATRQEHFFYFYISSVRAASSHGAGMQCTVKQNPLVLDPAVMPYAVQDLELVARYMPSNPGNPQPCAGQYSYAILCPVL